ncbi:MAG: M28 family peptidase [Segetibacter sp.]
MRLTEAAEFISNEFKKAHVKAIAGNNGYLAPFLIKNSSNEFDTGYNVLSALEGKTKPNEVIIFSAHYDHVGTFSTNPYKWIGEIKGTDSIYNGANDNATGVAAVILLARYFAAMKNNERTLLFVTFAGEELDLLGSKALSQVIQPDPIIAVINIEMIGRAQGIRPSPFVTGAYLY